MTIEWIDGKAIYLQIMEHITGEIAGGVLQPGQKVKSVREYAAEFGVNPNTVQRALHELEREGVLSSHRNTGRFVTDSKSAISKMREEQAEQAAREFCNKMIELGYDVEDAKNFFREKVEEMFCLQSKRVV